jgi:hypothetical protein
VKPLVTVALTMLAASLSVLGTHHARAASEPFAALPSGRIPPLPDAASAPASIEHGWIAGLVVRAPYRRDQRVVEVTDGRCLSLDGSTPTQASIWLASNPGVVTMRSERLVRDASGAHLDVSDLWIDPATSSVRESARSTIALGTLAGHASGFAAYAFRDGDAIEIIVTTHGAFLATSPSGDLDSNDCDHARVRLDTSAAAGDSVVVTGRYDEREAPRTLAASASDDGPAPRMWTAQLSASASRTKSDPSPVLSLTMRVTEFIPERGWHGGT